MLSCLFIPDSQAPPPQSRSKPAGGESSVLLTGKRVVIVEDEGITQMQLRRILTRAGLSVVGFAVTGEEGMNVVLRLRPDIVLMDIKMPGDIDGLEAARRILAEYSTCILMLTAYIEYREEAQQLGACGYIVKPIDSTTLLPQVEAGYRAFIDSDDSE